MTSNDKIADAETHNLITNDALYNQHQQNQGGADPFINNNNNDDNQQNNHPAAFIPPPGKGDWCTSYTLKRLGVALILWFVVLSFISTLVCNAINLHLWFVIYNKGKINTDCDNSWIDFTSNDYGDPSHLFLGTIILAVLGLILYLFSLYVYFSQVFGHNTNDILWQPYFGRNSCHCFCCIQIIWLLWIVLISLSWGYYFEYVIDVKTNCLHSSEIYKVTTMVDYFYLPFIIPIFIVCVITILMGLCRCFC